MTIQAIVFLHQIKKAQQSELGTIYIDESHKAMKTDSERSTTSRVVRIDLSKKWESVDSMTDYLQEEGLLERLRPGYFYLTHKGYHFTQAIVLDFLFKSIAVPIGVAALTTLVTLWIQGLLTFK